MKKNILLIILVFFSINYTFSQKVIKMNYENGIYTIPCKVNGIPMKFIFDTGASDVSISLTEAKFLLKQGLLNEKDIIGNVNYKIANGEIEKGTKIILRKINIDGIILNNIEANIVHELDAPLLLGQSAISKLGAFKLDGNKLIINENENKYYSFLNIDLTKTFSDFGFNPNSLKPQAKNGLLPVDMSQIKEYNLHFLSSFNLKERVVFDLNGRISFIILADYFENLNGFQQEVTAKKKFKLLSTEVIKRYGKPETTTERVLKWNTLHYEMLISLNTSNELMLMYVPKIAYNNPIDNFETYKNKDIKDNKELINKEFEKEQVNNFRDIILSSAKYILNKGKFDDNSFKGGIYENDNLKEIIFPKIENDNLVIYFDREYKKISPSKNGKKILKIENRLINGFCYDAFSRYFGIGKSSIEAINNCELNNIIFRFEIIYADKSSRTINKTIKLKHNKIDLNFPYTKKEFISLLK